MGLKKSGVRKSQPLSLNVQQKDRAVSHKNQASPVSRRLLFPAFILAHDVYFTGRVAVQTPFLLIYAAIP